MFFAGVDVGSTTAKAVIIDEKLAIVGKSLLDVGSNIVKAAEDAFSHAASAAGLRKENISYVTGTGYGRYKVLFGQAQITEISCHAKGAWSLFPKTRTLLDIGGQDTKAIRVGGQGEVLDFVMNDKCAAGTGRFLAACATAAGLDVSEIGEISLKAHTPVKVSNVCTVFVESEIVSHLARGKKLEDILMGVHNAIAGRCISLLRRVAIEPEVTLTGGVSKNIGMVSSLEQLLGLRFNVSVLSQYMGAIGAALFAAERVKGANLTEATS